MSIKLVITEKPSVAKDIAKVLGNFKSREGYLENSQFHITWAVGHLIELATPDEYVGKGRWSFDNLPIIPDIFKLNVSPKTVKQYKTIESLIKNNHYEYVICATDAGREGELIFRYIYQMTRCTLPIKRLWISSMAPADIKKGFDNLLDGHVKENLAQAAYARAEADWLVGMNGSRAMSVKHGDTFSVGRVQTPTLAMLVKREFEIRNFVPLPYWEVQALFKGQNSSFKGKYFKDNNSKIDDRDEAHAIINAVTGQSGVIHSVEKKRSQELPPKLFNLTDLQRECNKRYGFSAAKTLELAQKLYEEYKLITYPRTDSNHLASAQEATFPSILRNLNSAPDFRKFIEPLLGLKELPVNKRFVDDKKLTDHHAIIPTEIKPELVRLSLDLRKVYNLIAKRFIAVFYQPCKAENTTILTLVEDYAFKSKGKVILDPGWTIIFAAESKGKEAKDIEELDKEEVDNEGTGKNETGKDSDEDVQILPPVKKGDIFDVSETLLLNKETRRPANYTEASLLGAMETAGKLIEDEALREQMKGLSLGTPATRASIIETLISRKYLERQGKKLIPTPKGIKLINLIPVSELKQPELTAHWERRLADMEQGRDTRQQFMTDIKGFTANLVLAVKSNKRNAQRDTLGKCPKCGGRVVKGNFAWGCVNISRGSCDFKVLFINDNYRLTDRHVQQLLSSSRRTEILKDIPMNKKKAEGYFLLNNNNLLELKLT